MKPESKNHINFCKAVAEGMTQTEAYKTYVSPKKSLSTEVAQVEGSKLAKKYAEHIQELKQRLSTAIDKAYENDAVKEAIRDIMDKAERMAVLTKIARGEIKVKKPLMTNQRLEVLEFEPDCSDIKNAINELNKMDGSHAPTKQAQTDKEGNDVTPETWLRKFKGDNE